MISATRAHAILIRPATVAWTVTTRTGNGQNARTIAGCARAGAPMSDRDGVVYEVIDAPPNTEAWLRARKSFLGASDVACVLGLSKWATPLGVYLEKLSGAVDDEMTERQKLGHKLEPVIAELFGEETGTPVFDSPGLIRSTVYPWLGATPDRVNGDGEPIELKSSDAFMKDTWADGPPVNYRIQVLVQMICLGASRGWLAVLHGGNEFDWYPIEWDQAAVDLILERTQEFWEQHIEAGVPPEPVMASEAALAFPNPADVAIEGGEELLELHGAYGLALAEKKEIEQSLDGIKLELQKAMGEEATSLTSGGVPLFTWKPRKGAVTFDRARFAKDHPDLAEEYLRESAPTRTFSYKPFKEKTK